MAIEHDSRSFPAVFAHLDRSWRMQTRSTCKPTCRKDLAVLLILWAYVAYITHLYSCLPRLTMPTRGTCGRRTVAVGYCGAVRVATSCLFRDFQYPRSSVGAGRESTMTVGVGWFLVADHAQRLSTGGLDWWGTCGF